MFSRSLVIVELTVISYLVLGGLPSGAEPASALRRCLDEAADAANRNNCASKLQQQDENVAPSTADREAYRVCMDLSAQETKRMTELCQKEEAKRQAAKNNSEEEDTSPATPVPAPRPKDTSKPATDTAKKTPETTAKGDKETTNTATPKTRTSTAGAQAQIDSDMAQCRNYETQAQKCCGNPLSCAGSLSSSDQRSLAQMLQSQPSQGQSLTEYCNQMRQQSANSTSVNNGLAAACSSPQASCSSSCASMGQKYINLANANLGTEFESLYASAADQFYNAATTCDNLASRASQLASQGISGGNTNGMSQACQQSSLSNPNLPSSNGNPVPTSPNTMARLDATVNCQANPQAAECLGQDKNLAGRTGFDSETTKGLGKFDVPDIGSASRDYFANNNQQPGTPAKVGAVPNNTGGGVGGGGNSTHASLGSNPRGNLRPGSPGYTTDILQGTTSGGGYSYGQGSGSGLETNDYGNPYARAQRKEQGDKSGLLGMDLRQFLPGGKRDPRRALAGFNGHSEINAKEEDIWKRISVKMVEKCKLGVLWRCE